MTVKTSLAYLPRFLRGFGVNTTSITLSVIFLSSFSAERICAQTTVWIDANGNWFDAANWSDGVPNLTTHAMINNGGTAQIDFGGVASAETVGLGFDPSDSGNLLLDHASSLATDFMVVGHQGTGTLNIANAASLLDLFGIVGNRAGSTGTVTVDGPGSTWATLVHLIVGHSGSGTLEITRGGVVSAPGAIVGDGFFSINDANSSGTLLVDGPGSTLTVVTRLTIGNLVRGTLHITNGGLVEDRQGEIGNVSSANGEVTVDGVGSRWINSENLEIGGHGNGTLHVINGGAVSNTFGSVGSGFSGFDFGTTGRVIVDGVGSTWTNSTGLSVGRFSTGSLAITNGGRVLSTISLVGDDLGGVGMVTVDGAGSVWMNSGDLFLAQQGTGALEITNGGSVFSRNGFISGAFLLLNLHGSGIVTVDGAGSNWTNSGQLFVGNFGTGTLQITNGGAVSNTSGFVGHAGAALGAVAVDGAGSTWTNDGALIIGEHGTGTLRITNGGTVSSSDGFIGSGFTFTGPDLRNSGLVSIEGSGSSWVNSGNLYVGGSLGGSGNAGLLRIDDGGTVHALSIQIWDTGTLELGVNPILDTSMVTFTGGTLRTIADTTYTNTTTLAGAGIILDSNGFNSRLTGVWTGTGGLTKINAGRITLTNANTFTGDTHVDGGSLFVNGSIESQNSFISAAGFLGGTGSIGGNVFSSGIVSPGDSGPGRLTLNGSYTQNNSGTLQIEIGGFALGQHDLLQMNGAAQLDGTLQILRLNNFHFLPGDKVTFLTAARGVSGTFSTVTNPFNDTIVLTKVVYDANQVSLEAVQGSFAGLSRLTPNQRAVANNLDVVATGLPRDELIAFLNTELLANLPHDYDLIAPEELASIYETGFSQARMQSLNLQRRMEQIRSGSTGFSASGFNLRGNGRDFSAGKTSTSSEKSAPIFDPSPENRWGIFVTGAGEYVNIGNEDMNARGYHITTGGVTLGLDFRPAPNFALGVNAGYAHSSAELVDNGRVTVEGGKIGVYATYFCGGLYLDSAVGAGWNTYDTRRRSLGGDTRGQTDGAQFEAMIGTGYDWKKGNWSFGPAATFQYSDVGINAFREGRSLGSLEIQEQNESAIRSILGVKVSYDWKTSGVIVRPDVRVGWQHEYGDQSYPIDARFASGAGNVFTVRGPAVDRDKAVVGAGVTVQWSSRVSAQLYYRGQLGGHYDAHGAGGGVSLSF